MNVIPCQISGARLLWRRAFSPSNLSVKFMTGILCWVGRKLVGFCHTLAFLRQFTWRYRITFSTLAEFSLIEQISVGIFLFILEIIILDLQSVAAECTSLGMSVCCMPYHLANTQLKLITNSSSFLRVSAWCHKKSNNKTVTDSKIIKENLAIHWRNCLRKAKE